MPRYGFVGRNGLGKTTVLRMISEGQLRIPSHITVLHVEQEVVGDETPALQSVLEADVIREGLLKEEKELTSRVESGAANPEESSRLTEVFQSLEAIDSAKAPARAAVILSGFISSKPNPSHNHLITRSWVHNSHAVGSNENFQRWLENENSPRQSPLLQA